MCALKGACKPRETTTQCGRRTAWKSSRTTWSRFAPFRQISCAPSLQVRGPIDNIEWVLPALKAKGYAILELRNEELSQLRKLYGHSREFFQCPSRYKENFKFFPIPGGYLTPYPGTYEVFELRRGLPKCPQELQQAMSAFALLEQIALSICAEIGREIGLELAKMPSETSSAMRCIHYDRPLESRGFGDLQAPKEPPPIGTPVRLVGLSGTLASLNGLKGSVISSSPKLCVSLAGAPQAVLHATGSDTVTAELENLRLLSSQCAGMYPAHTDSSLVTVAPRSSAAGLEVKDLQTGEWFNVEEALHPEECLVFAGDPLDYVSGHRYPALMHRPAVCSRQKGPDSEHRISTPFFLYPRADAVLTPKLLPQMVFDDLNGNINGCRDRFPWKKHTCYYSDLVYSEHSETQ